MNCSKCHFENPDTQKFCGRCGAELAKVCSDCGKTNPPDYSFCGECGHTLDLIVREKGIPEAEGERKHITVLFSDLSGFTSLSEKLDPEQVKEMMSRIFGEVAQIVDHYEGVIEKYIGDAIMAVFGTPKIHEDDPIRAVRAALDINDFIKSAGPEMSEIAGKPIMMHTGINTGLAVIGEANLEKGILGVLGDTINVASRLMNLARPGEIVIGQNTYRLVRDFFSLEKMAPVRVKGKSEKIQAYRLIGMKAKVEESKRPSKGRMSSQIVGRDAELSVLHYCLERLFADKGTVVSIIGEAGIGKSRLIEDSFHYARKNGDLHQTVWLQGSTLSYGQTISYWPFIEIFSNYCNITEEDDDTTAREKLETKVIGMFGKEANEVLPYIASLMNLEAKAQYRERTTYLDGDAMRRQIFLATHKFFESLSLSKPLVLVFEDLHWMDESSGALLEHIIPLVKKRAILIVMLYRPDHETPAIRLRKVIDEKYSDSHQEIRIAPLRNSDSLKLVGNLLSTENLPSPEWQEIIGRSQGNPFFIEEVIRSLIDSGAIIKNRTTGECRATEKMAICSIPDTLQGLIIARIDRLDQEAKRVLRSASVVGRCFLYRVLSSVETLESKLDKALEQLQSTEIIRENKKMPELEYIFTHALVQQATYESILLKNRKFLHREVGHAIETMFENRLEEFYGLLAYHFAKAEAWEKAHEYLMAAGDQAGKIAADSEALIHYKEALSTYERAFGDHWETLQRVSLERKIGEALYRRGEMKTALEYLHRCLSLMGKPMKTKRWSVRFAILGAIMKHANRRMLQWFHQKPPSDNVSREAEEEDLIYVSLAWIYASLDPEIFMYTVLRRLNASESNRYAYGIATVSTGMGFICDYLSFPALAAHYHQKSVKESEKLKNPEALGLACFGMAYYEQLQGNWTAAIAQGKRGAASYRLAGDLRGWAECVTYGMLFSYISIGEIERCIEESEELIKLGKEVNDPTILCRGLHVQSLVMMRMGKYEESIPFLKRALKLTESIPDYIARSEIGALLGECYLYSEELQKALETLEESERINTERRIPDLMTNLMLWLAEVYLVFAEKEKIDNKTYWLKKARHACKSALKAGKGSKAKLPRAIFLQGKYFWLRKKPERARKLWLRSRELAEKMDLHYELGFIDKEMGARLKAEV